MKVHRVVLCIMDFDNLGAKEVEAVLQNMRYPNRCMSPKVIETDTRDIGEWNDDHPLNKDQWLGEFNRIFSSDGSSKS